MEYFAGSNVFEGQRKIRPIEVEPKIWKSWPTRFSSSALIPSHFSVLMNPIKSYLFEMFFIVAQKSSYKLIMAGTLISQKS